MFRKYLLPGLVFQSLVIGGGYGTGRELVEFFLTDGPTAGLLGMLVATLIWSVVLAISFEFARLGRHYDYRSFLRGLLGPGWVAYEAVYLIGLVLVVSVLGSAAGAILEEMLGVPTLVGNVLVIGVVGVLAFYGSALIERVMSVWSFLLYGVFFAVVVLSFQRFGGAIVEVLQTPVGDASWLGSGARYAAYNVGIMPAMLFVVRHLETRREAVTAGLLAGALAMIPGVFIFVAMLAQYPGIESQAVPADYLLQTLGSPVLRITFQIILFGTFIETGIGLVHGFNERVAGMLMERGTAMSGRMRVGIAASMLIVALFVADAVGLVGIIASGYGALTWGYWVVFVIPVLTIGIWKILKG